MTYIVELKNYLGADYYLRSTILTGDRERAQVFPTAEAAQQAIVKAKPFQKASVNKALQIVEVV